MKSSQRISKELTDVLTECEETLRDEPTAYAFAYGKLSAAVHFAIEDVADLDPSYRLGTRRPTLAERFDRTLGEGRN